MFLPWKLRSRNARPLPGISIPRQTPRSRHPDFFRAITQSRPTPSTRWRHDFHYTLRKLNPRDPSPRHDEKHLAYPSGSDNGYAQTRKAKRPK